LNNLSLKGLDYRSLNNKLKVIKFFIEF